MPQDKLNRSQGKSSLSQDKIRLMADLAIYEKHHKHDIFVIDQYYRWDYIFWHVLLSAVRLTFCFFIGFAVFVIFNSETLFYNINLSGITETLKTVLKYYIWALIAYSLIAAAVYAARYKKARKGMLFYATKLRRLAKRYHYFDEDF